MNHLVEALVQILREDAAGRGYYASIARKALRKLGPSLRHEDDPNSPPDGRVCISSCLRCRILEVPEVFQ